MFDAEQGKDGRVFWFQLETRQRYANQLVKDDSGFQHGEFGGTVVCVRENYRDISSLEERSKLRFHNSIVSTWNLLWEDTAVSQC